MEERRLYKRTVGRGPPRAAAAQGAHRLRGDARSAAEGGELRAQERGSPHEAMKAGGKKQAIDLERGWKCGSQEGGIGGGGAGQAPAVGGQNGGG